MDGGNGWVLAGLAGVLDTMPRSDPLRRKYEHLLRDMATRIAELQQADCLWKPSLLDPEHYPLPEISGSAFFTYGVAWGVNHGPLDRKKFGPSSSAHGQACFSTHTPMDVSAVSSQSALLQGHSLSPPAMSMGLARS